MDTFDSPVLQDVAFNTDGSLKTTGKQNVKFYPKRRLSFRAVRDENGDLIIDKKTGLPKKEAFEEVVDFVRIETKGDTNIYDDTPTEGHKRQFYRQYKFYKEGRIPDGNPIEDFEFLQPSTVMELHMIGIHVIQQVAEMSEIECSQIKEQSGFEIRDIAAQWININSPSGQASKASRLEMENAKLKKQLEEALSARTKRPLIPAIREEAPVVEEALNTIELTPEQLTNGRGRPRKV